jgi:hypothetical protein
MPAFQSVAASRIIPPHPPPPPRIKIMQWKLENLVVHCAGCSGWGDFDKKKFFADYSCFFLMNCVIFFDGTVRNCIFTFCASRVG